MNKRFFAFTLAMVMIVSAFTGCNNSSNTETPQTQTTTTTSEAPATTSTAPATQTQSAVPVTPVSTEPKVYRYSDTSDVKSLNILSNTESALHTLMLYAHSGLYRYTPSDDGKAAIIVGDIAKADPYLVDTDGYVWRIDLREEAVWHNGDPINADTFMYTYKMLLDPLLINDMANMLYNYHITIVNAMDYYLQAQDNKPAVDWEDVGIKKVGDYSLEITTIQKYTVEDVKRHFTDRSTFPVYEPYYEAGMNDSRTLTTYGTSLDTYMGCGPYFFDRWNIDADRVFVKNPDHWMSDYFNFDRVEIRVSADRNARVQMWENNEIDYLALDAVTLEAYRDDPRTRIYDSNSVVQIDINSFSTDNPILQTFAFRQAMFYAMDRVTIAGIAGCKPANFFVHYQAMAYPEQGILYRDTPEAQAILTPNNGYDPVLAKQYFDQALAESGQSKAEIEIIFRDNNATHKLVAEFLQQSLAEIFGADKFSLILTSVPNASYAASRNFNEDPNCYDMRFESWGATLSAIFPWYTYQWFVGSYSLRPNSYVTADFDAAYEACFAEDVRMSRDKVLEMSVKLEEVYLRDIISVPLYSSVAYLMYSDKLVLPCDEYVPMFGYGIMFADMIQ